MPRKKPASAASHTAKPAATPPADKPAPRTKLYAVTIPGPEVVILPGRQFHVHGGTLVIMQPGRSSREGRPRVFAPGTWLGMEEVE